jgi:hypothetical protein
MQDRILEPPDWLGSVAEVVFWPAIVCVSLSGPGAPIGPPERNLHEATPLQFAAVFIGIGLSWTFYSSLAFFAVWLRSRLRHRSVAA